MVRGDFMDHNAGASKSFLSLIEIEVLEFLKRFVTTLLNVSDSLFVERHLVI